MSRFAVTLASAAAALAANAAYAAGNGSSAHGGDAIMLAFAQGRTRAYNTLGDMRTPDIYDETIPPEVVTWMVAHVDDLRREVLTSKLVRLGDDADAAQQTCAATLLQPGAEVDIAIGKCRGAIRSAADTIGLLAHESSHHLGIEDEDFADQVGIAVTRASVARVANGIGVWESIPAIVPRDCDGITRSKSGYVTVGDNVLAFFGGFDFQPACVRTFSLTTETWSTTSKTFDEPDRIDDALAVDGRVVVLRGDRRQVWSAAVIDPKTLASRSFPTPLLPVNTRVRLVQQGDTALAFAWDGTGFTVATLDAANAQVASTRHYALDTGVVPRTEPFVTFSAASKAGLLLMVRAPGNAFDGYFLDAATGIAARIPIRSGPGGINAGGVRSVLARSNGFYLADDTGFIFFSPTSHAWGGIERFVKPLGFVRESTGYVPTALTNAPSLGSFSPGRPALYGDGEKAVVPFDGGLALFAEYVPSSLYYHLNERPAPAL